MSALNNRASSAFFETTGFVFSSFVSSELWSSVGSLATQSPAFCWFPPVVVFLNFLFRLYFAIASTETVELTGEQDAEDKLSFREPVFLCLFSLRASRRLTLSLMSWKVSQISGLLYILLCLPSSKESFGQTITNTKMKNEEDHRVVIVPFTAVAQLALTAAGHHAGFHGQNTHSAVYFLSRYLFPTLNSVFFFCNFCSKVSCKFYHRRRGCQFIHSSEGAAPAKFGFVKLGRNCSNKNLMERTPFFYWWYVLKKSWYTCVQNIYQIGHSLVCFSWTFSSPFWSSLFSVPKTDSSAVCCFWRVRLLILRYCTKRQTKATSKRRKAAPITPADALALMWARVSETSRKYVSRSRLLVWFLLFVVCVCVWNLLICVGFTVCTKFWWWDVDIAFFFGCNLRSPLFALLFVRVGRTLLASHQQIQMCVGVIKPAQRQQRVFFLQIHAVGIYLMLNFKKI